MSKTMELTKQLEAGLRVMDGLNEVEKQAIIMSEGIFTPYKGGEK